jgi:hypothetical protein
MLQFVALTQVTLVVRGNIELGREHSCAVADELSKSWARGARAGKGWAGWLLRNVVFLFFDSLGQSGGLASFFDAALHAEVGKRRLEPEETFGCARARR